ncbi:MULTISPECIES: DUF397 domain-containing protein [unclassified Streptomyces]|uniref:DUF397 domain-containing protein n=1 Tax=unclassified Streptomyces TaxID=2593676 RepID=UPI0035E33079
MTHSSSEQQRHHIRVPDASALTTWRKSSYSGGESGDCLEVNDRAHAAHVPVRDSKNPHGPAVVFTSGAWTAFLGAVKAADRPRR